MPASRSTNSGSSCKQRRAERAVATDAAQEYPIWTPLHAFDAADTLLQMLQTHQGEA